MRKFPVFYQGKDYLVTTDGGVYNFNTENCICELITIEENERIITSAWSGEANFPFYYKNPNNYSLTRDNLFYKNISKDIINTNTILINGLVFKKIIGFSRYYIADGGLIYSLFYDKILHHKINKANYLVISLVDDTGIWRMVPIHRLLWYTWNNKVLDIKYISAIKCRSKRTAISKNYKF